MEKYNYLGENIRWWRKLNKLSQTDFAKKINKKTSVVSAYEKGAITPPIDTLMEICKVIGVSFSELIGSRLFDGNLNSNLNSNGNSNQFPLSMEIEKINKGQNNDIVDFTTDKGQIATIIAGNLGLIDQTKLILKRMAEQHNYNYVEENICPRFVSLAKRFRLDELIKGFEGVQHYKVNDDLLDEIANVSHECVKAILRDLQSFAFFIYVLSDETNQ